MNVSPKKSPQGAESLKNWFLGAYVVGALGMVAGYATAEQDKPESNYIILFAGIAAMIAYWIYADNKGLTKGATNRMFGDSMYYMGFLFTLTSLAMALLRYLIGEEGVNAEAGMQQMFHIFGSAVITTIFGLLVRTYSTQFNKESADDLEESRAAVSQVTAGIEENFQQLGVKIDQQIQEYEIAMKKITDAVKTAVAAEQKMVDAFDKAMADMPALRLGDKAQQANEKIDEFNIHLGKSTDAVINLHKLADNFARAMQDISAHEVKWTELNENIAKANEAVNQVAKGAQIDSATLAEWKKAVLAVAEQVKELEHKTDQISNALENCKNLFLRAPQDIKRYVRVKYMEMLFSLWKRAKNADQNKKRTGWHDGGAK